MSRKRTLFLLVIIVLTFSFFSTKYGRALSGSILLVTEIVPGFPIKPLKYLSREPQIKEVIINTSDGEAKADLYIPADNKKHPAVVFTLGTILAKNNEYVTKTTKALSRAGYVVLVPELPDLLYGTVWTDSVNILIPSVLYLDEQTFVDKQKIGIVGFCVGASVSIIAAEDARIADKVAFISAISPYFDLKPLTEATLTKKAKVVDGSYVDWEPHELTTKSVIKGYVNLLSDEEEKKVILAHFLEQKPIDIDLLAEFSQNARTIYGFLKSTNKQEFDEALSSFSEYERGMMKTLSPSTEIAKLKAKILILNDKKDSYVPKIEGIKLAESLPKEQVYFIEVDSFEHTYPKTKLKRLAAIRQLLHLGRYLYKVIYEIS